MHGCRACARDKDVCLLALSLFSSAVPDYTATPPTDSAVFNERIRPSRQEMLGMLSPRLTHLADASYTENCLMFEARQRLKRHLMFLGHRRLLICITELGAMNFDASYCAGVAERVNIAAGALVGGRSIAIERQ